MDKRLQNLENWLTDDLGLILKSLQPASADAGFRRYFRAQTNDQVFIVMDAPPEFEPTASFISIANMLRKLDLHTPIIHEQNTSDGFLLLEDLGNTTFLDALSGYSSEHLTTANVLYKSAIDALIRLQGGYLTQKNCELPHYDAEKLYAEMNLFEHWFAGKHFEQVFSPPQTKVWESTKQNLIKACQEQPEVWVHRDFHSRNLMVTEHASPGVIDFQDMVIGPIGYDLASIFKDCYVAWSREDQIQWLKTYQRQATKQLNLNFSLEQLVRWVDYCGLQRHLKVLGIFCRLHYRDGKTRYLADLPLVAKYILEVLPIYPELSAFTDLFSDLISRALKPQQTNV